MPEKRPHTIDGIEEYDNPLPRWWVWMFYGCIAWSVAYWIVMPSWFGKGLMGWSQHTAYAREVDRAPKPAAPVGGLLVTAAIQSSGEVQEGRDIFRKNCAACHGATARGKIGPDLVKPKSWAIGNGEPAAIAQIISQGTAKGMPSWKAQLGPQQIIEVSAFVHGLSNPADPHHPQLP